MLQLYNHQKKAASDILHSHMEFQLQIQENKATTPPGPVSLLAGTVILYSASLPTAIALPFTSSQPLANHRDSPRVVLKISGPLTQDTTIWKTSYNAGPSSQAPTQERKVRLKNVPPRTPGDADPAGAGPRAGV